jgi:hypothetical protein
MMVKRAVFLLAGGLALLVALVVVYSLRVSEDDRRHMAEDILRKGLSERHVKMEAFVFQSESKHPSGTIYTWKTTTSAAGRVGVTISAFDEDLWGDPIVPDCLRAKEESVMRFGDICYQ